MSDNLSGRERRYRMVEKSGKRALSAYAVQVRGLLAWHTVKVFESDDRLYSLMCANELLESLRDNIE